MPESVRTDAVSRATCGLNRAASGQPVLAAFRFNGRARLFEDPERSRRVRVDSSASLMRSYLTAVGGCGVQQDGATFNQSVRASTVANPGRKAAVSVDSGAEQE